MDSEINDIQLNDDDAIDSRFITDIKERVFELENDDLPHLIGHTKVGSFNIRKVDNGLLFRILRPAKGKETDLNFAILHLINRMNRYSAVARFAIYEQGQLYVKAYYTGAYDKTLFSQFLNAWGSEVINAIERECEKFSTYFDLI